MAGSGVLHGTGFIHAVLPWWVASAGVVTLGAVAGARFANTTRACCSSYSARRSARSRWRPRSRRASCSGREPAPFRIADLVVAFSPGAQDTMMVLALALHLDPVFVGAHHVARFLVVTSRSDRWRAAWRRRLPPKAGRT